MYIYIQDTHMTRDETKDLNAKKRKMFQPTERERGGKKRRDKIINIRIFSSRKVVRTSGAILSNCCRVPTAAGFLFA